MILAADYSQLELRVLAHLSKDQRLLQVSGARAGKMFTLRTSSKRKTGIGARLPGAERRNGRVPLHRCRVEEHRPRVCEGRPQATGQTGRTRFTPGGRPTRVRSHQRVCVLQICYGIIYGMGAKSLGEQMGVGEDDAACYIESFKARYKG